MPSTAFPETFNSEDVRVLLKNDNYAFEICLFHHQEKAIQFLFTRGLSTLEQAVNENNSDYRNIELVFCLPDYFNLSTEDWPIKWLDKIAVIPKKNKTWFGPGDTIPAGKPPLAISHQLNCNHFILMKPRFTNDILNSNEGLKFLAVVPIFQEELDYKLRNSHTVLFKKFEKRGVDERIDMYRQTVCRKRILGMF